MFLKIFLGVNFKRLSISMMYELSEVLCRVSPEDRSLVGLQVLVSICCALTFLCKWLNAMNYHHCYQRITVQRVASVDFGACSYSRG